MALEIKRVEAPAGKLGEVIDSLVLEQGHGQDKIRAILAIRMNQYANLDLTEEETKGIAKAFLNIELGSATNLVMMCSKSKCLYRDRCVLFTANKCPEGRECIHENKVLTNAFDQYVQSLEVGLDNYPELVLVNQLVEYELIEYRCNAILSYDHINLKMKSVIGIDVDGNVITKEDISHALQIKMQVFKNKIQLLESFTATRKEKYKKQAALKESKDGHAKLISSMKSKLKDLRTKDIDQEEVQEQLSVLGDNLVDPEDY